MTTYSLRSIVRNLNQSLQELDVSECHHNMETTDEEILAFNTVIGLRVLNFYFSDEIQFMRLKEQLPHLLGSMNVYVQLDIANALEKEGKTDGKIWGIQGIDKKNLE